MSAETAAPATAIITHSYWCSNCNACVHISTTTTTTTTTPLTRLSCPHCHANSLQHHRCPNPNPNPNFPFIIIFGPFPQTPLHSSDAIDFDDDEAFNLILSRITTAQDHHHSTRTAKSFIDSIKSIKYSNFQTKKSLNQCAICKDEFTIDDITAQLLCKHVFHFDCIVPWLNRSNLCPLCRFQLPGEVKSAPLMKYVVRLGDMYVEGWGEDYESGYRDAVLRNGLVRARAASSGLEVESELTRIGRAEMEMGPVNSEETVSSPLDDIDGQVDGVDSKFDNRAVDEDGDAVMSDDRQGVWD